MKKFSFTRLRRLLVLTAVILLIASLTGCLGGNDDGTEPNDPSGTTPVATDPSEVTDPVVTDPPATDPPQTSVMGTVTANNLNVRSNTSIDSTVLYQLAINTRVEILEQRTVDDTVWGRIADGWINMHFVQIDGEPVADPTEPSDPDTDTSNVSGETGTITASELHIREGAGSDYDSVGKYKKGDKVTILETKNGWGRTDKGWVSMKYVDLDGSSDDGNDNDDTTTSSEIVSDGKTIALGYGVVDIGSLNVRTGPGTKYDKVGEVSRASRYAYYEKSGNWVRIKDGWVSTSYFYIEGTKGSGAGNGTIIGSDLNARSGPGTGFDSIGGYSKGDKVEILHQLDTGSGTWGYTSKGWVSMKYVDMGTTTATGSTGKATVTASELNIRKSAGTDADKVGSYKQGDKIEILEVKDGWGRTDKGWVSMNHVTMGTTGKGTVTASSLTIRKGAGTGYEKVGSYENGAKIEILEVKNGWGRTDKGWVSLDYVKMD